MPNFKFSMNLGLLTCGTELWVERKIEARDTKVSVVDLWGRCMHIWLFNIEVWQCSSISFFRRVRTTVCYVIFQVVAALAYRRVLVLFLYKDFESD